MALKRTAINRLMALVFAAFCAACSVPPSGVPNPGRGIFSPVIGSGG